MKIYNNILLTAALVAASLVTITQTAPFATVKTKSFNGLQECLYLPSSSTYSTSFCYKLLNPTQTSTDNLTPAERTLRHVFFTEAASIWFLYGKWSECVQRTVNSDKGKCKPRLADYNGLFLLDFKADKYQLVSRFETYALLVNQLKSEAEHCMLFHGSTKTRYLLPLYEKRCTAYAHLTWDNVQPTDLIAHFLPTWRRESYIRHGIRASAWPQFNALQLSFRNEEALFDALYLKSSRNSTAQNELSRSVVNQEVTSRASDFSSSNGVSLDGLSFIGKHYVRFVRANIVYDCLKYHRTERVHWCEDVFKRVAGFWSKDCPYEDRSIKSSLLRLKAEEEYEWKKVEEAAKMTPLAVLPKRLAKLCELYSIDGKKVKTPRPKDCEEGGLYYPFL